MWIVTAKCLEMIARTSMLLVCGRNRSERRMTEYQEASCSRRWMQQPTGNERRPTVAIDDMPEPAVGVMRMSADDRADQQH